MPKPPQPFAAEQPNQRRRTLLKAGIAGGAVLLLARWMVGADSTHESADASGDALDQAARVIVAALVPVMLEGALPAGDDSLEARAEVVAGVDRAIAGLPAGSRKE